MKKIILTLGIMISAYSTYAINTNNQSINEEEVVECTRINRIYDRSGELVAEIEEPCPTRDNR